MPPATSEQKQILPRDREALALQKIRPELNIEKWPLWKPASSKNPPRVRAYEREITLPDGTRGTAKLTVGFTDKGDLTTEDQKTWYALIKDWEEKDRPEGLTSMSLRRLAKHLDRGWGTNVIDALTESLRRLRVTPFSWENSYFDKATGETIEILDTFNILSELKIVTRKKDGVVKRELGYFRFNDFIIKNILAKNTKPLLFHIVTSFKSEIAQILYTHIDLILTGSPLYERRTKELFDELGIIGKEYGYPSGRKRILERALKELSGKPLSSGGVIASATLEKTKDGKDYKVIFRKGAAPKAKTSATDAPAQDEEREAPDHAPQAQKLPTDAEQKGEELLRHFHKVFFGIEATSTRSRHRDLATALVAQHGWEMAVHIVDFSHAAAQETNFKIATFGGITQYVDRAVASYHEQKREQERQQQKESEAADQRRQERTAEAARRRAQERYDQLPEDERRALIETYSVKLTAESPTWADAKAKGVTSLLNTAARSAIIEDFIAEEQGESREATAQE